MSQTQSQTKDPIVNFRSVKKGKNSKQGDRIELYLTPEAAAKFASDLAEQALSSDLGIKVDLHINQRVRESNGKPFDTAFAFIKSTQEGPNGPPKTQVVVAKDTHDQLTERMAALKKKQIG
jgi:hypothetical protein